MLCMFISMVEVGGVIFWILVTLLVIYEFACYEHENKWASGIGFLVFILIIWLFGNFRLLDFVKVNWFNILELFGVYTLAGLMWGIGKWWFFTSKQRQRLEDNKREWLDSKHLTDENVPANHQEEWTQYVIRKYNKELSTTGILRDNQVVSLSEWPPERVKALVIPQINHNKARFVYWMAYWPISLIWTLLRDVLAEMWDFFYRKLGKYLHRIAVSQFKGVEEEFASTSPSKGETKLEE